MGDIVRLDDLTLGYRRHPAVHHLSGGFRAGSLTAVVGPNGAGKSTLLKGIAGALAPAGGRVTLHGVDARDIAYLPQQADIDRTFPIEALDTVLLGHWRRVGAFGAIAGALRERARAALAAVGLDGFERRPIGALSAGQFQRVLFARMLVQDARLILLDEPFTAIDARTTAELLRIVRRWHGEKRTVIAVLHDLEQVRAHFPETLLLAREPVAWGATADALAPGHLARARDGGALGRRCAAVPAAAVGTAGGVSAGDLLLAPFLEFAFMRRALVACIALALGCGPIGVLLVLRRMSLVGDAMAHAVLPGAAIGFVAAGLSLWAMGAGGFLAGIGVAVLAGAVSRATAQREDASFAAFYLISLAAGVLIVSLRGSNVDLMHVLFGTILAVDDAGLLLVAAIASLTLLALALAYRPLVVECFDPGFLRAVGGRGGLCHVVFLTLVVLNLVGGFQALGTLMAVGLMMLPAAAARFWAEQVWSQAAVAAAAALASGWAGLLLSYHLDLPSGPSIILVAGGLYLLSMALGPHGSLRARWLPGRHLEA